GHPDLGRSIPGGAFGRLREVVRSPHRGGRCLSSNRAGGQTMSARPDRFTPLQRLLHWLMALCILAMLFIGVGMVSTVAPRHLALVSIHKPLGVALLVLVLIRLVVRLRSGAPSLPADLPEPMKLAAVLSHYALYALMIAMPLIGWAMMSAAEYPVALWPGIWLPQILPQSASLYTRLWNA